MHITKLRLPRMKKAGLPWLGRSLTSGSERQSSRTRSNGSASPGNDPDRPRAHDLLVLDGQGAVGKGERAAHTVHSGARLDPVARLRRLEEVDREADRRAVLAVLGVGLDCATEREVGERGEQPACNVAPGVAGRLVPRSPRD